MKKALYVSALLLVSTLLHAQSANELVSEGKKLINQFKQKEALDKFEAAIVKEPTNAEALQNASYMLSQLGEKQKDNEAKKPYFEKARDYAVKAIKLNDKDDENHFVYAVALGRLSLIAGSEEKLKNAKLIKAEAERTIQLNPKNAGGYHILGRLNREIANMSAVKVMAAKAVFGGIPEGCSFDNAEKYFSKAMELRPNYILYYYDAALNYDYMGKKSQAKTLLQKAVTLPLAVPEDPYRINDCKNLLAKYN